MFTPKDRLASWFEQYAETHDLVVWLSSTLATPPTYDKTSGHWDLSVNRNGTLIRLRPAHLVMASGFVGEPRIPTIQDRDSFKGISLHASEYQGGAQFKNMNVIVVGACNTSHDVCQDLVYQGAASVTMVQRSSTCVISNKALAGRMARAFPDNVPVEVNDFKSASVPFGMVREILQQLQLAVEEEDKELLDGLRKAGFMLNSGANGDGIAPLIFGRAGGSSNFPRFLWMLCHSRPF